MRKIFRKGWFRWALIIVGVAAVSAVVFGRTKPVQYETATVSRGDVVESVTATGQIKPKNFASLRFETAGSIAELHVDVGDVVKKEQLLARLNAGELSTKVLQAQADVKAAEVARINARQTVSDTQTKNDQSLSKVYADSIAEFDEILNLSQKAHGTFKSFYNTDKRLMEAAAINIEKGQPLQAANDAYPKEEAANTEAMRIFNGVNPTMTPLQIDEALRALYAPLKNIQDVISVLLDAMNAMVPRNTTQTVIDTYRASVETAQANINSAISKQAARLRLIADTITTSALNVSSAKSAYETAVANLEKSKAALKVAQSSLANAALYAPISGIVAAKNKSIGESVTATEQVYYILGEGGLEIIANIPEVDIGRISVGVAMDATLDALGPDEHFSGNVTSIDPDQTTVEGVVYYRTHFEFDANDPRFRSGMTVNLTIVLAEKKGVITVPRRSVNFSGGKSIVRIFKGEEQSLEEREVIVSLRGEKNVEIISGVVEGEKVVLGEKKPAIR